MREGDTIRCLLMSQRSERIDNGIQKSSRWIRGYNNAILDSKAYPSNREQRKPVVATRLSRTHSRRNWIPTLLLKIKMHWWVNVYAMAHSCDGETPSCERSSHRYTINIPSCFLTPRQVAILESTEKTSKRRFLTPISNLTWLEAAVKYSILVLMWLEYEQGLITWVIEYFLIFPMVIYTHWYDQWFRSYSIWKLAGLPEFNSGQNRLSREIWTFYSISNAISGSIQNQHHSSPSQPSNSYTSATIGPMIRKLWVLRFVGSCWKFLFKPKELTYRLRNLGLEEAIPKETMNINVVVDFINSLKRVETQNFDIRRRNYEAVKLVGFSRYDYDLESVFKFLLVFKICFLMQYECIM
jgi:hypothetical protein